jgi:transcriptional regulator with PAS, ATPase and Fis domain
MGLRTNLINLDRDGFYRFFDSVQGSFTTPSKALVYRSFPHVSAFSDEKEHCRRCSWHLDKPSGVVELPKSLDDFESSSEYRSFVFGHRAIGEAISVWWYSKDNIDLLIKMENETGYKRFPRFCCYNPFFQRLDTFCWEYSLKFLFVQDNYGFIFDNRHFEERRLVQCHDFLSLLQTLYFDKSFHINSDKNRVRKYQYEDYNEKVWPQFRIDRMQELLSKNSIDFICDYIDSTGKVDSPIDSIIDVIEGYLGKIYDSALSPKKRNDFIEKANSNHQKRIEEVEKSFPNVKIISKNDIISDIKVKISQWAPLKLANSFLILGEPGTGKEIFAKAIHEASKRKGRWIKVDCSAITGTLFESEIFGHLKGSFTGADRDRIGALEQANGGSIFFDEIGNLPLNLQPKLLRALQDRKYVPVGSSIERSIDAKIIFATNKNLDDMVGKGLFMPDLYDRFKIPQFTIPPLKNRKNDIEYLVKHFIKVFGTEDNKDYGGLPVTIDCLKFLKSLDWPGNVRDIENAIKYIMINRIGSQDRSEITEFDLPAEIELKAKNIRTTVSLKNKLPGNKKFKDEQLIYWMKELGNNKTRVADKLGVHYKTIWQRWKRLGL